MKYTKQSKWKTLDIPKKEKGKELLIGDWAISGSTFSFLILNYYALFEFWMYKKLKTIVYR